MNRSILHIAEQYKEEEKKYNADKPQHSAHCQTIERRRKET